MLVFLYNKANRERIRHSEEKQIYRRTNLFCLEAGRDRNTCKRGHPQDGDNRANFLQMEKKYAGMLPSDVKKLKQLEEENRQLKKLVADLSLDKQMLQDVLSKKF